MTERHILLGVAIWLTVFGIWPIAHPSHTDGSPMAMADLLLHALGAIYLGVRWALRDTTKET